MKRLIFILLPTFFCLISCNQNEHSISLADDVVNKSIKALGGLKVENSTITFTFRDKEYKAFRDKGLYKLERIFKDSIQNIKDTRSNSGFSRFVNDELISLPDSIANNYSNSVNSVHYFSVLPYGLNDAAANKSYLGLVTIKGKEYHKIRVTFDADGGGEDFEDVFVYWFDTVNYKLDYLAYSFHVNGGGMRFREAFNERIVNGIRFVDYNNFEPREATSLLINLDGLFEKNELKLLSKIELQNIRVVLNH